MWKPGDRVLRLGEEGKPGILPKGWGGMGIRVGWGWGGGGDGHGHEAWVSLLLLGLENEWAQ